MRRDVPLWLLVILCAGLAGARIALMLRGSPTTLSEPIDVPPATRPAPRLRTVRARVLARDALLLGLATLASVLVARQVVVAQIDERIDEALLQQRQELQRLVEDGVDPDTGEPLGGRVRRILEVFLQRNVPSRGEAYLTFVAGRPYLRSAQVLPYRLDQDERLVELWGGLQRVSRARVDTPAGEVDYLAVPVRAQGETEGLRGRPVPRVRDPQPRRHHARALPRGRARARAGHPALLVEDVIRLAKAERPGFLDLHTVSA